MKTSFMVICWVAMAGLGYSQTKKTAQVKTMGAKPAAAKPKTPGKAAGQNTLLWEITGNGLENHLTCLAPCIFFVIRMPA
ncbi:hypothetical protein [Paraflavitalea speifideaquila]|uniref:hypothetical protein n=1 Tax=Paraflavitalea speifideaquila TaxID=3076558 RepID=UPI0028EA3A59|nr:hypothetical protein [Paraflavitalea speifideiaquila]